MVSKGEVKRFLSKINPIAEKIPDITEKLSKLEDDEEFQNALEKLGTIGGLFSIGLTFSIKFSNLKILKKIVIH
jgi:hypothetical protein